MADKAPNPNRRDEFPTPVPPAVQRAISTRQAVEDDVETSLWQGGYSPKAMIGAWIFCGLLTVVAIVVTILFTVIPAWATAVAIALLWIVAGSVYAYRRLGVQYELTSQRFMHQSGVLRRRTDRIEVIDIDDVVFEQGPVQRMFGIGMIRIESSDRSHPTLSMQGIANVKEVAGLIDDIRRKERRKRSLHIEAV